MSVKDLFPYFPRPTRNGATIEMDQPDGTKIVLTDEYKLFIAQRLKDWNAALIEAGTVKALSK